MKYDYLIVGAGLFGCVCAQELKQRGKKCLVLDKRNHIGGNIYTEDVEGIPVHRYGAHIFHTSDEEVWQYVNRFVAMQNFINSPVAIYEGRAYNLPFNMNTFAKIWDITTPQQAQEKIAEERKELENVVPRNLEEQAVKLVGKTIYRMLVKGYTEKQWGRDCKDLPPFIIKRLPVRFTYDNNYFNDKYQAVVEGGYTRLAEKLLEGTEVLLNTDYADYAATHDDFEKVIYTGAIDEFFGYRFGHLQYRSVHFETSVLDTENYQGNAVVNYTERSVPYTRIIEHKHFARVSCPKTVISKEYSVEWTPNGPYEPYYPVNDEANGEILRRYEEYAKQFPNVVFGGRLGEYKYYDMDKVIRRAFDVLKTLQ